MMGSSPRCYIPNFVEISPLVPEKNFFKPNRSRLHMKFGFDSVSEKMFKVVGDGRTMTTDAGP